MSLYSDLINRKVRLLLSGLTDFISQLLRYCISISINFYEMKITKPSIFTEGLYNVDDCI